MRRISVCAETRLGIQEKSRCVHIDFSYSTKLFI